MGRGRAWGKVGDLATRAGAAGWMGIEVEGEQSQDPRDEQREVTDIGEDWGSGMWRAG